MERKVRVAQYGLGAVGKRTARYMVEHGGELVAAFARSVQVGQPVGEVIGVSNLSLPVSNSADLERILRERKPDICVFATKKSLWDIREAAIICLKNKVNVLDIGENAFWPWSDNERPVAEELDQIAKENGVTISASGCPDVSWGTLICSFAASSNRIEKIRCDSFLNLEAYNADYMFEYHGVGLTVAEFEERFGSQVITEQDGHIPCLPGDQNAWLCAKLGLTVKSQTMQYIPIIRETDFYSASLGKTIPAGQLEGLGQLCRTETEEGIVIELMMGGKTDVTGAAEHTVWTLTGEPDSTLVWDNPATYELTCATAVNRIPQIIDAPAGYVTTDRLGESTYLVKPMNAYVTSIDE